MRASRGTALLLSKQDWPAVIADLLFSFFPPELCAAPEAKET